jgi:hypothetical protein
MRTVEILKYALLLHVTKYASKEIYRFLAMVY